MAINKGQVSVLGQYVNHLKADRVAPWPILQSCLPLLKHDEPQQQVVLRQVLTIT